MSTHRLTLPWRRPPLTANQRQHWTQRHRLTAETRQTVAWLARAARIPAGQHCTVTLMWAPGDRRRRDTDNLVPTLKAACDGLLDARVVPDDTPQHMTKHMPIIAARAPGMWLDVTVSPDVV